MIKVGKWVKTSQDRVKIKKKEFEINKLNVVLLIKIWHISRKWGPHFMKKKTIINGNFSQWIEFLSYNLLRQRIKFVVNYS